MDRRRFLLGLLALPAASVLPRVAPTASALTQKSEVGRVFQCSKALAIMHAPRLQRVIEEIGSRWGVRTVVVPAKGSGPWLFGWYAEVPAKIAPEVRRTLDRAVMDNFRYLLPVNR